MDLSNLSSQHLTSLLELQTADEEGFLPEFIAWYQSIHLEQCIWRRVKLLTLQGDPEDIEEMLQRLRGRSLAQVVPFESDHDAWWEQVEYMTTSSDRNEMIEGVLHSLSWQ